MSKKLTILDLSKVEWVIESRLNLPSLFSKKVAKAIEKTVPCLRIGTAVVGLEVPHAHLHLVPLNNMDDINFSRPKLNPTPQELSDLVQAIKENLE